MAPVTRLLTAIVVAGLLVLTAMGYIQAASHAPSHKAAADVAVPGKSDVALPGRTANLDAGIVSHPNGESARRHGDGGKPNTARQFDQLPLTREPGIDVETATAAYGPADAPIALPARL
jgi:hypothetical protein